MIAKLTNRYAWFAKFVWVGLLVFAISFFMLACEQETVEKDEPANAVVEGKPDDKIESQPTSIETPEQEVVDEQSEEDKERERKIKEQLELNFKDTSWYGLIKSIKVSNGRITIETDLYDDDEGKKQADFLCNVVAYLDEVTADDTVVVNGQLLPLASCYRLN